MAGIYIHIPFCRRRCYYCDFFSVGSRNAPWESYASALLNEAHARRSEIRGESVRTLYIGGGTPSQMPLPLLEEIIRGICDTIIEANDVTEITVELNPEDVTPELAAGLRAAGVNRVSMGIQSFIDSELRTVGRRHTSEQAKESYRILSREFSNISIDLIFGLPTQSLTSWEYSVSEAIALNPTHISAYSLMWEERSALSQMQRQGRAEECDEELSDKMYLHLTRELKATSYEHYEISNYSRAGYRSLHNSSYWRGDAYLGLGAGAHSYDGERIRRSNREDIARYIAHFSGSGGAKRPFYEEEILCDEELREEYIMTRLRRSEGIEMEDYRHRFGEKAFRDLHAKSSRLNGMVLLSEGRLRLCGEGLMRSDTAIVNLL